MNKFDELYKKISKITELMEKIPISQQEAVFQLLLKAAIDETEDSDYYNKIMAATENGKLLKEYINSKKPSSNIERTLLFANYLNLNGFNSTIDEIAACYKICELDMPGNLLQNLRDCCSAKYGYLMNVQNKYVLTDLGRNFCENA